MLTSRSNISTIFELKMGVSQLIGDSLKAYGEYTYPKPRGIGLLDHLRLIWDFLTEQDPERKKFLWEVMRNVRAAKRRNREIRRWNKMFSHGRVISRKDDTAKKAQEVLSEYERDLEQTVNQDTMNRLTSSSSKRLRDAQCIAIVENVRMLETMVKRGEELKTQTSERESRKSRQLMEQKIAAERQSHNKTIRDVINIRDRSSQEMAELTRRCGINQSTRQRILHTIMKKADTHSSSNPFIAPGD